VLSALFLAGCGSEAALCEGVVCEDDGNECTNDVCDPATGTCHHVTVEDDTPCDFDGLPGLCKAGVCEDAMLCEGVECEDDGNECTDDACDPATGMCENTPVQGGTACADGRGGCYGELCNFVPVSATVGDKELVFDHTTDRCAYWDIPDNPARFVRDADGELVLFGGNAPIYYVSRGADFDSLARVCDPPALVSADLRTPESYENWEWLWSIYREGPNWHALIHNEFHDTVAPTCKVGDPSAANPCWYNSLTYGVSTDGARSFVKPGAPAHVVAPTPSAWSPPLPGTPPWFRDYYYLEGYVNPSNIILGPEDYYYAIIPALLNEGREEGACGLRTRTLSDPASWRAWDGNGFNLALESPYQTGGEAPACEFLPAPKDEARVVSSFSLTYNTYLGRYMLVTEWGDPSDPNDLRCGIYFSLSTDLIHWSEFQEITPARVGDDHSLRRCPPDDTTPGQLEPVRVQYASIIDHEDSSINFERPGRTPYLYYTRHNDGGGDRDLVRVPVKFTMGGPLCEGVDCDDQNQCTDDLCNGADGSCEHTPIDCADSNDCTIDACNPTIGCEHAAAANGTPCGGAFGTCQDGSCAASCTEQGILDAIALGGGPHTFDCATPTTVVTTAEIVIDNDVVLDGQGQLTVHGDQSHRVFSVAGGTTAELIGFTVTGGATSDNGGGIVNYGTLTLTNSTVSGNSTTQGEGGGILNQSVLVVDDTVISDNTSNVSGGGILNFGHAELNNCELSRNVAMDWGGGVATLDTLFMTNTTVSENTAPGGGGGIGTSGLATLVGTTVSGNTSVATGGGIANSGNRAVLAVINSTISGNAVTNAGGGGIGSNGTMTVISTTISQNTAVFGPTGIWNDGSARLRNTIVEGDCWSNPAVASLGGNIESESNTCGFGHPTDQVSVPAPLLLLDSLQDNGGSTMTHALLPGSVAVDVPGAMCVDAEGQPLTTDQRGELRPAGPGCDAGAYELQP